mmetsp:Transcript_30841/g.57655  ORF Transcript_30841/g.57655 Transcript_30841/m.57655 type:complete len:280 (+) Transcript_30841:536-1375(+)
MHCTSHWQGWCHRTARCHVHSTAHHTRLIQSCEDDACGRFMENSNAIRMLKTSLPKTRTVPSLLQQGSELAVACSSSYLLGQLPIRTFDTRICAQPQQGYTSLLLAISSGVVQGRLLSRVTGVHCASALHAGAALFQPPNMSILCSQVNRKHLNAISCHWIVGSLITLNFNLLALLLTKAFSLSNVGTKVSLCATTVKGFFVLHLPSLAGCPHAFSLLLGHLARVDTPRARCQWRPLCLLFFPLLRLWCSACGCSGHFCNGWRWRLSLGEVDGRSTSHS